MAEGGTLRATLSTSVQVTKFGATVRAKLIENKLAGRKPDSLRGLARVMARGNAALAENHKRSLFKWSSPDGPRPLEASRALVAHALGNCEPDELADDDEESDPAMRAAFSLFVDLMDRLGVARASA